jgi:hypothetical protein
MALRKASPSSRSTRVPIFPDPDDTFIVRLRAVYAVTKAEHMVVLDELFGGATALAAKLGEELRTIERSALTIKALEIHPSPTHDFPRFLKEPSSKRLLSTCRTPGRRTPN